MGKENSKAPIVDFSEKPHLYVKLSENIFLFQMFPFFIDHALPVLRYENNFLFDLLPSVSQSLKGFCKLFSFCLEMNQSLRTSNSFISFVVQTLSFFVDTFQQFSKRFDNVLLKEKYNWITFLFFTKKRKLSKYAMNIIVAIIINK